MFAGGDGLIAHWLAIEEKFYTFRVTARIAVCKGKTERVIAGHRHLNRTGPARSKMRGVDHLIWRRGVPVELHLLIDARHCWRSVKAHVVEVLALQPKPSISRCRVQRRPRNRERQLAHVRRALGILHVGSTKHRLHPGKRQHGMRRHGVVVAFNRAQTRSVWPHHSNRHRLLQRQHAIILKQHDRLTRGIERKLAMRR